jgi:hypothetical protein
LVCAGIVVGAGAIGYVGGDYLADAVVPVLEDWGQSAMDTTASLVSSGLETVGNAVGDLAGAAGDFFGNLGWT